MRKRCIFVNFSRPATTSFASHIYCRTSPFNSIRWRAGTNEIVKYSCSSVKHPFRAGSLNYVSPIFFYQRCLAITPYRYYAIAAPLHYVALVSPRRVIVGLAVSWTGALLLCLPPFSGLVPPYRFVYMRYTYTINYPPSHSAARTFYDIAWQLLAFPRIMNEIQFTPRVLSLHWTKLFRIAQRPALWDNFRRVLAKNS